MTDKNSKSDGATVLSRRDAIIGALALAAGTLVASKPDVALAATGDPLLIGLDNTTGGQTQLIFSGVGGGPIVSLAAFNYSPGNADAQFGVFGTVSSSTNAQSAGVWGQSALANQAGVWAQSLVLDGVGLKASAPYGTGLLVEGKATLNRSGRGYVLKGHSTATVVLPPTRGVVESNTLILVTLQGSAGTGVYLRYAKRISDTSFQVALNKAATVKVYFAWMLLN